MADAKISALSSATTPLAGTEEVPLVQSGTTKLLCLLAVCFKFQQVIQLVVLA